MLSLTPTDIPQEFDYQTQKLDGRTVLVTGGTTGIGRAIALLLADRGAKVLIFGRHRKELDEALADLQTEDRDVEGFTADQSDLGQVKKVFEKVDRAFGGKLDILVNNAAIGGGGMGDTELADIGYILNTNLLGYVACAKEAFSRMQKRGGHIVMIGSMSADVREASGSVYVATKAGIQGFSEAFRKEANKAGVKVSLIEPGAVGSDMQPNKATHARKAQKKEMLKAEDIAACVYYCLTQPERCDVVEVKIRPHKQEI
jgi:NAD(P)-dependent dehydrogenase (short-subunit alcohol dehydrogenase family)